MQDCSGIYIFTREENGLRYAYIGQALKLLTRTSQHLSGYQHIDLSIKKRGLYDANKKPNGWRISFILYDKTVLDEKEQSYIKAYADSGYQLYNHTTGSQGDGKCALGEAKSPKGYRDGVAQGEKNVIKKIAHLFNLHLKAVPKADKPTKTQEKAQEKFYEIIGSQNEIHS